MKHSAKTLRDKPSRSVFDLLGILPFAMDTSLSERACARLIVFDPPTRAMLWFAVRDPSLIARVPLGCTCWVTPGGGVDPGETFVQTAVRELWEETGLVAGHNAAIGTCLFDRRCIVPWGAPEENGKLVSVEQWFPVTLLVPPSAVSNANLLPYEQSGITAYRFWTADEMREAVIQHTDAFFPDDLADILDNWHLYWHL